MALSPEPQLPPQQAAVNPHKQLWAQRNAPSCSIAPSKHPINPRLPRQQQLLPGPERGWKQHSASPGYTGQKCPGIHSGDPKAGSGACARSRSCKERGTSVHMALELRVALSHCQGLVPPRTWNSHTNNNEEPPWRVVLSAVRKHSVFAHPSTPGAAALSLTHKPRSVSALRDRVRFPFLV